MSLDFSNVKLKKTVTKDSSKTLTSDNFMDKYIEGIKTVYMDVYYAAIKDYTFKTFIIPLSPIHAKTLIAAHERFAKDKSSNVLLTDVELKVFTNEFDQISRTLKEFNSIFVKLSSRSPKDIQNQKLEEFVAKEFEKLSPEELKDNNARVFAVQKAAIKVLKISNLDQVIELLVKSVRVYEDMLEALNYKKQFNISIIVREVK